MAEKTMNEKIATGQAMNLAVADAIATGKQTNTKYVVERFLAYYDLGVMLQGLQIDEMREIAKGK